MKIGDQRKLRERLGKIDAERWTRFRVFELEAKRMLEYSQAGAHLSYTPHGLSHITRVEEIYDWLLSDEDIDAFTGAELFCLLCATYCHDMFMIPKFPGDEARARAQHATKAGPSLRTLQSQFGLTTSEATYIGDVIRGHHVEHISELGRDVYIGSDLVRVSMLGACLSMADICHADESRAPEVVRQYLSLDENSSSHWTRHMQISGISRSGTKLVVSSITFSDEGKAAVERYVAEIRAQLQRVSPYFQSSLTPITEVELQVKALESELDQDLSFKTDTAAVLNMLVHGIYQRSDVFVRELMQNALDATYVEQAQCRKNGRPYWPKIAVAEYRDSSNRLLAIRIDDNGSGMDPSDVRETLLRIGRTRNSKESIQQLLQETGKCLIANFGVGLLSCFSVASNLVIRTQKSAAGRSFEVRIGKSGESVDQSPVDPDIGGTSVMVYLSEEFGDLDADVILNFYCRLVSQAQIYFITTRDEKEFQASRKDFLAAAEKSGISIEPNGNDGWPHISGNGFYCCVTVPWDQNIRDTLSAPGELAILNDGIFVCEDRTSNWLPASLEYFTGYINFAAKAVDLPMARNAIVENSKLEEKRNELQQRSSLLFERIVAESPKRQLRDKVALILSYAYTKTAEAKRAALLRGLSKMCVQLFDESFVTFEDILKRKPGKVYVCHQEGAWVNKLATMDGSMLWSKKDDTAAALAEIANRQGHVVIRAVGVDELAKGIEKLREMDIIHAYFKLNNVPVIDLLDTQRVDLELRSLALPRELRALVGNRVKFVESGVRPEKLGWDLGEEIWLNVTNPKVRRMYDRVRGATTLSPLEQLALMVLINLIDNQFEAVIEQCLTAVTNSHQHTVETLAAAPVTELNAS